MKRVATLLSAILLCSTISIPASNSAIAGTLCKTIGAQKKSKGALYLCKKVGSSKVWVRQRLSITKQKPADVPPLEISRFSPDFDYIPAANAAILRPCSVTGAVAATIDGPVKCDFLWNPVQSKDDTVETRGFRNILNEYLSQSMAPLNITWRIDPSTPDWKLQIQSGKSAGAQLWGPLPDAGKAKFAYVSPSQDWLFEQFKKDGLVTNDSRRKTVFQGECSAALTTADDKVTTFWFYNFNKSTCLSSVGFLQVASHEYSHYAQEVLSDNAWSKLVRIPWLDEGVSTFVGSSLGPMSKTGNNLRSLWVSRLKASERDLRFFNLGTKEVYGDKHWTDVYPVGAIAVEAMVALLGFQSIKQIYVELGKPGATYNSALLAATGLNSDNWISMLQGYVDGVKNNTPWSLQYLTLEFAKRKS